MKRKFLVFQLLVFSFFLKAQSPQFQWVKGIGGLSGDWGATIVTDANGNVYSAGAFKGSVDFDPGPGTFTLGSITGTQDFILKLDPFGNFVWARCLGDSSIFTSSIETDLQGNVYLAGHFTDTLDFDPGSASYTLAAGMSGSFFILKLDPNGNFLWARTYTGGSSSCHDLKCDNTGNVYSVGQCSDQVDFDPGPGTYTLAAAGDTSAFVSKMDPSGNIVWAKLFQGTGYKDACALTIDIAGNICVGGRFFFTVDFDPGTSVYNLSASGSGDAFVCKLTSAGNFVWAKSFGASNSEEVFGMTTDKFNSVYICGNFMSTVVDFDPGPGTYSVSNSAFQEGYILKLFSDGNFSWVRNSDAAFVSTAFSIAYDKKDGIYFCGGFSGPVDFDPGPGSATLSPVGFYDGYISRFDTAGNFSWVKSFGGSLSEAPEDIALDNYGNIFTTGFYEGTVDFDFSSASYPMTSNGNTDFFVHKINTCQMPSVPMVTSPASSQTVCANHTTTLAATSTGTIYWYLELSSIMTLVNTGHNYTPALPVGSYTLHLQAGNCNNITFPTVTLNLVVDPCTGINENQIENNFLIYPNPASELLNVTVSNWQHEKDLKINVINVTGQSLIEKEVKSGNRSFVIDVSSLPANLYFLRISDGTVTKNVKIVKD